MPISDLSRRLVSISRAKSEADFLIVFSAVAGERASMFFRIFPGVCVTGTSNGKAAHRMGKDTRHTPPTRLWKMEGGVRQEKEDTI